jgi:hypothetical protein
LAPAPSAAIDGYVPEQPNKRPFLLEKRSATSPAKLHGRRTTLGELPLP